METQLEFKSRMMKESTKVRREKSDSIISEAEEIIKLVSMSFGTDIKKRVRARELVAIRQSLIIRFYHPVYLGWTKLGRLFNIDHSSVIYNYAKAYSLMETNDDIFVATNNRIDSIIKNYYSLKNKTNEN